VPLDARIQEFPTSPATFGVVINGGPFGHMGGYVGVVVGCSVGMFVGVPLGETVGRTVGPTVGSTCGPPQTNVIITELLARSTECPQIDISPLE